MIAVTAEQMRELDRRTIEEYGVPGEVLMERAGQVVYLETYHRFYAVGDACELLWLLIAGKGNNGGDVFVVARLMKENGHEPRVMLTCSAAELSGDAQIHYDRMCAAGVKPEELTTVAQWEQLRAKPTVGYVVIDGVLGTGISGAARGMALEAIRTIQSWSQDNVVISVDIPSGLNADTGEAAGETVCADVTVTMGLPKKGLLLRDGVRLAGNVVVADIGIARPLIKELTGDLEMLEGGELRTLLPRRDPVSHKGNNGHVLVIGGSVGFSGAVTLAARGALRSGAGLVTVLTPASVASIVAGAVPDAMVKPGAEAEGGVLTEDALRELPEGIAGLAHFDAIVIGPGLSVTHETRRVVEIVMASSRVPVVVDADALNACSSRLGIFRAARCPVILTPHPGEMARLLALKVPDVLADREGGVRRTAASAAAVVVLKGAGTLVHESGGPLYVNRTGNPGMGCGGMGDVLSGMIGAFCGQGIAAVDAARLAVFLHGRAGDSATRFGSQLSLIASDIPDCLDAAIRELSVR